MPEPRFFPHSPTLERLFDGEWPMETDRYQRDYAWESDDLLKFIGDVQGLQRRRAEGEPDHAHFFGALVAVQVERPEFGRPKYEIVDGQQRLSTFSLAIAAVVRGAAGLIVGLDADDALGARDFISAQHSAFVEREEQSKVNWQRSNRRLFKVTTRDDAVFAQLLASPTDTSALGGVDRDSHDLMISAYELLYQRLVLPLISNAAPGDALRNLMALRSALADGSEFVFIYTKNRAHAHQLFSVLNDRGRRLEQADLLRAYTLMLASASPEAVQERVAIAWDAIDGHPVGVVDGFFRHYFASMYGQRLPGSSIYAKYRNRSFGDLEGPVPADRGTVVAETIERFRSAMDLYEPLSQGRWPFAEAGRRQTPLYVRDRLFRLVQGLGNDRTLPLLISAAEDGKQALATLVSRLDMLELRANVSGVEQNQAAGMYMDLAALLRSRAYAVDRVIHEIERWIARWAPDDEFTRGLNELRYGTYRDNNYIKHILTSLEDHLVWYERGGTEWPPTIDMRPWDFGQVTDDHIFPQGAAGGVPAAIADIVHSLGNQTVLGPGENSGLQNKLPTDVAKVEAYERSTVKITASVGQQLRGRATWGADEIMGRQAQVVAMALRTYAIPTAAPPTSATRPRLYEWRANSNEVAWLINLDDAETALDAAGLEYVAKGELRLLASGDVVALLRLPSRADPTSGIPALSARISGWGRVANVEFLEDGRRFASFATGTLVEFDPAIPADELGVVVRSGSGRRAAATELAAAVTLALVAMAEPAADAD